MPSDAFDGNASISASTSGADSSIAESLVSVTVVFSVVSAIGFLLLWLGLIVVVSLVLKDEVHFAHGCAQSNEPDAAALDGVPVRHRARVQF